MPRESAMPRGRTASDRTRPGPPRISDTPALASRAPRATRSAAEPYGTTVSGIGRPARPGKSDTSPRARERDRSPRPPHRAEGPRRRCDAALLSRHQAGPAVRRRSAGSNQGQPWKCADAASLVFRPHSVQFHLGRISAAAAVHSDFRRFAGTSCPPVSVCERSKHPCPSMVRKGSSVRVRQRACGWTAGFLCRRRFGEALGGSIGPPWVQRADPMAGFARRAPRRGAASRESEGRRRPGRRLAHR